MSNFTCQNCGAKFPSWVGRCSECGSWNSVIEEITNAKLQISNKSKRANQKAQTAISINDINIDKEDRILTGIEEFDRVLGGGIVKGSAILVAGEPGIGKSTLLLQLAGILSASKKVLYISGEESAAQIKLRSKRLGINSKDLFIFTSTNISQIDEQIEQEKPAVVIVDSVQTLEIEGVNSSAGSVSQVRESSQYLTQRAKQQNIPLFLVGQVTKDGSVAGPKILEHMVDTVLYFEGEQNKPFRILRAVKNRFGSTNEVGIFEMKQEGLVEVKNPSKLLLDEGSLGMPGSVVASAVEGSRAMLIEIQALTSYSRFPSPKRVVTGLDYNRASVIIGVLERKAGIKLSESDIYLSIASGIYVDEPAVDLPVAMAIATCARNKGIDPKTVVIGEIGLTGEIRAVSNIEKRLKESAKLGFSKAIIPATNAENLKKIPGIEVIKVGNIREAVETALKAEALKN
ncbi:MAG: DNA repair protein RadA [Candidatus Margulisiibacteriota bacterium]